MPILIKHRQTDAVLYTSETATTIREAVVEAVEMDANLADAYLAGAYLADAYLAGANLADAYLAGAYLAGANLADAYLADAYLAGANLADAYLAGAYLAGADLADADLAGAEGIEPSRDGQAEAAKPPLDVPVIPNIHRTLLAAVTAAGNQLDMSQWHSETCETTHCRAGWIITLAGEKGKALEAQVGPPRAASLIYRASDPGCRVPHWHATTERAMADIKRCAEEEAAKAST